MPGGTILGETDPDGGRIAYEDGIKIADVHATILHQLGVQHERMIDTPVGRPIQLSEGKPLFVDTTS